jgi:hypothetical protein
MLKFLNMIENQLVSCLVHVRHKKTRRVRLYTHQTATRHLTATGAVSAHILIYTFERRQFLLDVWKQRLHMGLCRQHIKVYQFYIQAYVSYYLGSQNAQGHFKKKKAV